MNSQAEILGRAIDGHVNGLSVDVAQFIVSLKLAESDERRMNELADKAGRALSRRLRDRIDLPILGLASQRRCAQPPPEPKV